MIEQTIANRYTLQSELGAGGMGTVYLGIDNQTHQNVAIKQLKSQIAQPHMIERFRREGEALRELNHPNIVKMLDAVEEDGNHYLVMEYVSGGDLKSLIEENKKLDTQHCINMAIDLADALTRAHRLNIIHRDLKPANVLIGDDNVLRLTDFGVAHVGSKERVTDTDAIVGTIDYLPPEAFGTGKYEASGDIWAFGVMLFEMLSGQRPFTGATIGQVIYEITSAPVPDLEELCPDAPTALIDLIYRMLERDPNARISSVRHVGAALEDIQQGRDTSSQIQEPDRFDTPTSDLLHRPKHNLPAQTTPFLGREAELAELDKLLRDSAIRLVTVLAPGGMGKTRLSLEAAERALPLFEDGVYFVDLAPLREASSILTTIASSLGYQFEEGNTNQKAELFNYLRNKTLLLVMDNYEHLMNGAGLTTEILNAAPNVNILVTSRRRLEQPGETLFHLSGMDFPDWETPEDALEYAAVKLFMQGAKRAQPDFELTTDNLDYVARICRMVMGMPLAIVLSAAWLGLLSVEEIAEELENGLDLLEAQGSDIPARQQSINVVFEYSWQMMTEDDQSVFMQLSIFRGGFTRQAAQKITGASLRTLMSLVNKSLIYRDADSGRYNIHELLRQYAHTRLEDNPKNFATTQAEHTRYYLQALAERTEWLKGRQQVKAANDINSDYENIRRAWNYASQQGWYELIEESFQALETFVDNWKSIEEKQLLWQTALSNCSTEPVSPSVCRYLQAELSKSEQELTTLLEFGEGTQDLYLMVLCHKSLQRLSSTKRDYLQALKHIENGLEVALKLGDPWYIGFSYYQIGFFAASTGDMARWVDNNIKSHVVFEENNNLLGLRYSLSGMGTVSTFLEGNEEEAYSLTHKQYIILHQLQQNREIPFTNSNLAISALYLGKVEEGRNWIEEAISKRKAFGDEDSPSVDIAIGYFLCFEEKYAEAAKSAETGLAQSTNMSVIVLGHVLLSLLAAATETNADLLRDHTYQWINTIQIENIEQYPFSTRFLPALARYAMLRGQTEYAVEICAIAKHHPKSAGKLYEILPVFQDIVAELREVLPSETFEAAWERGKTMEFSPIVKRFLEENAD